MKSPVVCRLIPKNFGFSGFDPSTSKRTDILSLSYAEDDDVFKSPNSTQNLTINASNPNNETTSTMMTSTPVERSSISLLEAFESPIKQKESVRHLHKSIYVRKNDFYVFISICFSFRLFTDIERK